MRTSTPRRMIAAFAGLSLVVAACGDDDSASDDAAPVTTAAPADDDPADDDPADDDPADDDPADDDPPADDPAGETDDWDGTVDPGITDTEIVVGSTGPLSGPASAYGVITGGYSVCADYINGEYGGITMRDGVTRQLVFDIYDDAYDPARAVENTRRLVEQDGVFALFGVLGTPINTAIIDYIEDEQVPNLLVSTGASRWGRDFASGEYLYTQGWQPAYPTESAIYVDWLEENHPGSSVAILMQNDDYGRDYVDAFERAVEGTSITIASTQTYEVTDPTVDQQVTELANSGADVFFNVTTPRFAAQAITRIGQLGWDPIHLLNNVSASVGGVLIPAGVEAATDIYSFQYFKDPTDPTWDDDPAMVEYREMLATYGPGQDPDDAFSAFMWTQCAAIRGVLEGAYPTRDSLLEAAANMDQLNIEIPMLLDGINVSTSPGDGYPLEAGVIVQFNGEYFETVGDVIVFDGETAELGG